MNVVRFEEKGEIFFTVHTYFGREPDAITAVFCKARDLPRQEGEAEDIFCDQLFRRLQRRHRWRKVIGSFTRIFRH